MSKYVTLILCSLLMNLACKQAPKTNNIVEINVPTFNADSAYFYTEKQVSFGPRVPNTPAHVACGNYLADELRRFGAAVVEQETTLRLLDNTPIAIKNIIGSFQPENKNRILLFAHWDSRPFADNDPNPANRNIPIDGANDGASGVGVLLEVARQLKEKNPEIGVDIIFFDAEDWGPRMGEPETGDWWCLGAQHWARNPHVANYKADYGILLDMVGAPNAKFLQEGISMHYASKIVAKVWSKAYQLGFRDYFLNFPGNPITDDHLYVNKIARIPMINIIHQDHTTGTGFFPAWHTLQDNISNIDRNTLYVVGTTVLAVIYDEK